MVEGKRIGVALAGTVRRLSLRSLDAHLDADLATLTNIKFRLRDPVGGQESGDLYGKVVGAAPPADVPLLRIRLTSVDAADQKLIETLLAG